MQASEEVSDERRRMRAATVIFAVATMFSRIAGTVRLVIVSAMFGTSAANSAFVVAFQIPNLIRALVADSALSAAFVPVFTELQEKEERERAWRVASTMAMLIILVLGPITIASMAFAPDVVGAFVSDKFSAFDLAVDLTRILMPIILLMALNGLIVGILNAHDHFAVPAIAPVFWNLVIIVALWIATTFVDQHHQIYWYAGGVMAGTILQVVMPLPWLRGRGGRIQFHFDFRDPKIAQILVLMLPVTISLGLINLQQLVDTAFSTHIPNHFFLDAGVPLDAGPAILESAFRVYMLPQGLFSVGISTVFFPVMARMVTRGDLLGFRNTFSDGLRQIFLLLIPSAALLMALSEPSVRLLMQRGAFDAAQTQAVADALFGFSFGLVFNGASLLLIRAFFSRQTPWIPTSIAVLTLLVNAVADALLYKEYGVQGIAFATSIVNVVAFLVMYVVLWRQVGRLGSRRTVLTVVVSAAASAIAAIAAFQIWKFADAELGRAVLAQLASLGVATIAALGIYLGIVIALGVMDRSAVSTLLRRGKRG